MSIRFLFSFLLALLLGKATLAQVNGYARLAGIAGTTVNVFSSDESFALFSPGKRVVIMQMQDNTTTSFNDNATFGNFGAIQMAGRYVVATIATVNRSGGELVSFTLTAPLPITFNFCATCNVQAITFEWFGGGGNYSTMAPITALPWNGQLGGVVAFDVTGTLTLQHSITADHSGFLGGANRDVNTGGGCDNGRFRVDPNAAGFEYGLKGEGIFRTVLPLHTGGKGKIVNGGGGGNGQSGGGGGGGNFVSGGIAGIGFSCGSATQSGGVGGIALGAQAGVNRIFMGGGGGGGKSNADVSSAGGNGGGVILIRAGGIITSGNCSGIRISADGQSAANAGFGGAGGGGAGGMIVIQTGSFNFGSGCPVTIRANGGNGGSSIDPVNQSGGGCGGHGAIYFSVAAPSSNATIQAISGAPGCNNNSNPCNSFPVGPCSNSPAVFGPTTGVLPVEFLGVQAELQGRIVAVRWSTATERDNASFRVERSADARNWVEVGMLPGAGNSMTVQSYQFDDDSPITGWSYYRIRQVDTDGTATLSNMVEVLNGGRQNELLVHPNPASDLIWLYSDGAGTSTLMFLNELGQQVGNSFALREGLVDVSIAHLPSGIYHVMLVQDGRVMHSRLVIQR